MSFPLQNLSFCPLVCYFSFSSFLIVILQGILICPGSAELLFLLHKIFNDPNSPDFFLSCIFFAVVSSSFSFFSNSPYCGVGGRIICLFSVVFLVNYRVSTQRSSSATKHMPHQLSKEMP